MGLILRLGMAERSGWVGGWLESEQFVESTEWIEPPLCTGNGLGSVDGSEHNRPNPLPSRSVF